MGACTVSARSRTLSRNRGHAVRRTCGCEKWTACSRAVPGAIWRSSFTYRDIADAVVALDCAGQREGNAAFGWNFRREMRPRNTRKCCLYFRAFLRNSISCRSSPGEIPLHALRASEGGLALSLSAEVQDCAPHYGRLVVAPGSPRFIPAENFRAAGMGCPRGSSFGSGSRAGSGDLWGAEISGRK